MGSADQAPRDSSGVHRSCSRITEEIVTVKQRITDKLTEALHPVHLDVVNESHLHSVPPGSESHFKVIVVASAFDGLGLVDRHRRVNAVLAEELASMVHALALKTLSPSEWQSAPKEFQSPPCRGGSKADA